MDQRDDQLLARQGRAAGRGQFQVRGRGSGSLRGWAGGPEAGISAFLVGGQISLARGIQEIRPGFADLPQRQALVTVDFQRGAPALPALRSLRRHETTTSPPRRSASSSPRRTRARYRWFGGAGYRVRRPAGGAFTLAEAGRGREQGWRSCWSAAESGSGPETAGAGRSPACWSGGSLGRRRVSSWPGGRAAYAAPGKKRGSEAALREAASRPVPEPRQGSGGRPAQARVTGPGGRSRCARSYR
jgi:hypothetical protein